MQQYAPIPLSSQILAEFYLGLSRLLQTGMPLDKALTILADDQQSELARIINELGNQISQGKSLADAGRRTGLWRTADYRLIQVGENSGNLVSITRNLSQMYETRAKRLKAFRSRMVLPFIVLIVGLLLAPLPGLVSGKIDAGAYLALTLLPVIMIMLTGKFISSNIQRKRAQDKPSLPDRLMALFPAGKRLLDDQITATFLNNLGLYLQAGVDADKALSWSIESANTSSRSQFRIALNQLRGGSTVSDALLGAGVLSQSSDYAEISSGEAAGQLHESILHRVSWYQEDIDLRWKVISEWLPRLIYAIVAAWVVIGMFT